jgi:hypothetical protein
MLFGCLSSVSAATALGQLVALFGKVRDDWIADDLAGWLAPNRIYPGVADAVKAAIQKDEVHIVTTKQVSITVTYTRCFLVILSGTSAPLQPLPVVSQTGRIGAAVLIYIYHARDTFKCGVV